MVVLVLQHLRSPLMIRLDRDTLFCEAPAPLYASERCGLQLAEVSTASRDTHAVCTLGYHFIIVSSPSHRFPCSGLLKSQCSAYQMVEAQSCITSSPLLSRDFYSRALPGRKKIITRARRSSRSCTSCVSYWYHSASMGLFKNTQVP